MPLLPIPPQPKEPPPPSRMATTPTMGCPHRQGGRPRQWQASRKPVSRAIEQLQTVPAVWVRRACPAHQPRASSRVRGKRGSILLWRAQKRIRILMLAHP
jgi:hypothetical protein